MTLGVHAPPSIAWIQIALLIFFAVFVVIVARVLLRRRGAFDAASQIPLRDKPTTNDDDGPGHS